MSKGGRKVSSYDDPDVRTYSGQVYRRVADVAHTRVDGTLTALTTWASHCATCGAPFTTRSPTFENTFAPTRRCEPHRKPGIKVGRKG